ncbi:MAG: hypothetical protein O7B99_03020 [Planctomycetota bacterium]|nr:hypothetical protein [Planctomycetota bacterium]
MPRLRVALLLLLGPLLLIGPTLLLGERLLPLLPVTYAPLATERPEAAAEAAEDTSWAMACRVFPVLTDQLAMRAKVRAGELPTWEPLLGLGVPLAAGTVSGMSYPFNWLAYVLPPDVAAAPLALLALFLSGTGMWLFLRRLGLAPVACAVGAVGMQMTGWGTANLFYYMKVDAALWLPWSLWAVEGLARGQRRSGLWLFGSVALSFAAGFPPIAFFGLSVTFGYTLWRMRPFEALLRVPDAHDPGDVGPIGRLATTCALLVLGVGGGAYQLLPMFEVTRNSERQGNTPEELLDQSLPVSTALGVVVPDLFASPLDRPLDFGLPVAWWLTPADQWSKAERSTALEWNTFAGVALVLLALTALVADPRRAAFPVLLLLTTFGFVQGWPVVRWLYHVPGFDLSAPSRALAAAWTLWPWLAALGVHALLERLPRATTTLVVAGGLAAVIGFTVSETLDPVEWSRDLEDTLIERYGERFGKTVVEVRQVVPPEAARAAGRRLVGAATHAGVVSVALVVAVLLAGSSRRRGRPELLVGLPLLLVIAGEGLQASRHHLIGRAVDAEGLFPASEAIDAVREAAGDGRVVRLDRSESGVGEVFFLAQPNLLHGYGIADLFSYSPFTPKTLLELARALDPNAPFRDGVSRISDPRLVDHELLDLLRVTAVIAQRPLEGPRLATVLERPGFFVYHRDGALPPARIVGEGVACSNDGAALLLLASGLVQHATQVLLEPGRPAVPADLSFEPGVIVAVERPASNRLDVSVEGGDGGILVMHEQWYPGWRATVNGEDVELERVDHVYRGVRIPPGDVVVRTWYEPSSLWLGVALTLVSCAGAALLAWRLRV